MAHISKISQQERLNLNLNILREDHQFLTILEDELSSLRNLKNHPLTDGRRWKRSPTDTLLDRGLLEPQVILNEFEKVSAKTSSQGFNAREAIKLIIARSLTRFLKLQKTDDVCSSPQ